MKFIAEIHRKSDPVAVIAGDDTASCDQFGSGKKNVYMFNPNNADFTMRLVRSDGTKRTIAQSLLTKDMNIKELVPEVMEKAKNNEAIHNIFSAGSVRKGKDAIALDNVEVNVNYTSAVYQNAIEAVCRDFFTRYVELYAEKENLQKDKVAVGKGYSDALNALPEEDNRSLPKAPIAYSDKSHERVRKLSLSTEQGKQLQLKVTLPKQVVRSNIPVSGANLVSALTFEDVLPLSYLESKIYKEVPALQQGLYDLENTLIAKDINNAAKERPNLSFKYTDRDGNMRGYILAYEGKVKTNGVEQPVIYLMDFASDSYLDAGKPKDHGDAGGKVLMKFARAYKQNYLDKGNMMPIFTNARSETSYAMLMKHIQVLGRKSGYDLKIDELGKSNRGGTTMHDVVIVPTHKRE